MPPATLPRSTPSSTTSPTSSPNRPSHSPRPSLPLLPPLPQQSLLELPLHGAPPKPHAQKRPLEIPPDHHTQLPPIQTSPRLPTQQLHSLSIPTTQCRKKTDKCLPIPRETIINLRHARRDLPAPCLRNLTPGHIPQKCKVQLHRPLIAHHLIRRPQPFRRIKRCHIHLLRYKSQIQRPHPRTIQNQTLPVHHLARRHRHSLQLQTLCRPAPHNKPSQSHQPNSSQHRSKSLTPYPPVNSPNPEIPNSHLILPSHPPSHSPLMTFSSRRTLSP